MHGSSPLDNETERCRRIISGIRGIFDKYGVRFKRAKIVYEALEAAYLSVQQNLPPDKRLGYHTLAHSLEAALFMARALSIKGVSDDNDRLVMELAVLGALVHDSGFWRQDWWLDPGKNEEASKRFFRACAEFSGLFTEEEKKAIEKFIDYTKFFLSLEEIESRSGFKGGFRLAGRLLAIGGYHVCLWG